MSKISDQLEEKKKKAVIELERKMRQRRLQRERTIMEIVSIQHIILGLTREFLWDIFHVTSSISNTACIVVMPHQ